MIRGRVQTFGRELDVVASGTAAQRSRILASEARRALHDAQERNIAAVGAVIPHETIVDGVRDASEDRVRPDGVIAYVFDAIPLVLAYIAEQLWLHSPYLTGRYQQSHRLLADGAEVARITQSMATAPVLAAATARTAGEWVFVPTVPYARKIERGWAKKAPDGVYQVVATLAAARSAGLARVQFGWRSVVGMLESAVERRARPGKPRDMRQPAIIVTPR